MIPDFKDRRCASTFGYLALIGRRIARRVHKFGDVMGHPPTERVSGLCETEFGDQRLAEVQD